MTKKQVGEKLPVLYRTVKFRATQYGEELPVSVFEKLLHISGVLTRVYNEALVERQQAFYEHVSPLYAELQQAKLERNKEAERDVRSKLKGAYAHVPTLFDQINALTEKRARHPELAQIPRNWQEETLDALDGGFKSFLALRKNGDYDSKPPRERREIDFCAIPGRSGFSVKGNRILLNCSKLGSGEPFSFVIPEYQLALLSGALRVKKFTVTRSPHHLEKDGEFWISVSYEIEKPETSVIDIHKVVYIKSGASSIGVVSPYGYKVIEFERPDKVWQPKIDSVKARMDQTLRNSRTNTRRKKAMDRMYNLRSGQAKLDERSIVKKLIKQYGIHFVIDDVIVRSKKGKLANSSKVERGGTLGLNWSAQNTGSFARFLSHLEEKVKEKGGSVTRFPLKLDTAPKRIGARGKIDLALALKKSYLASLEVGRV